MIERFAPLALLAVFGLVAFLVPTLRTWRRTGRWPVVLPAADDAYGYVGRAFKVLIVAVVGCLALNAAKPETYVRVCGDLPLLRGDVQRWLGLGLVGVSTLWVVVAQVHMGRSWRVGIDKQGAGDLVTGGLFRWSRNPIILGMLLALAGTLLLAPSGVLLSITVAAVVSIQVQVRLEEEFLGRRYGEAYVAYRQRVRRWL